MARRSEQHRDSLASDPLLRGVPVVEGFKVLDPAVLYAQIGRGGMGAVYRGRHCKLDLDVAVKCLLPSLAAEDPGYVERFEREARLAASLTHQNIVRVMDVQQHEGLHYLIMEYVRGETAQRRVERKGPLAEAEALAIMLGATAGLAEAHRRGIVHRDIKPDNVLISVEGRVKLADLGLARATRPTDGRSLGASMSVIMGTPQYMPPEQWESSVVGPRADVWALGATLWFLLAGRHAIENGPLMKVVRRIQDHDFPALQDLRGDLRPEIYELIACCVARDPDQRFCDAADLLSHLRHLVDDEESSLADAAVAEHLDREGLVTPPPRETLLRIRAKLETDGRSPVEPAEPAARRGHRPDRTGVRRPAHPAGRSRSAPAASAHARSRSRSTSFAWAATAVSVAAFAAMVCFTFLTREPDPEQKSGNPDVATAPARPAAAEPEPDPEQKSGNSDVATAPARPAAAEPKPDPEQKSGNTDVATAPAGPAAAEPEPDRPAILASDPLYEGFGEAIDKGIAWLVAHQDEEGRWDADGFAKHDRSGDPCDGPGGPLHDVGVTGLALMVLVGDGHHLGSGVHRGAVEKACIWLEEQQAENGLLGYPASHDFIYEHAIGTLALCEVIAAVEQDRFRTAAQRAIDYLESHRNPYGVWRYRPRDNDNDLSVTGWCLLAYRAAQRCGLKVNEQAIELGMTFLDQVSSPNGHHGYTKAGEDSGRKPGDHNVRFPPDKGHAMTAVGLHIRLQFGQDQEPSRQPLLRAAATRLVERLPAWGSDPRSADSYYWYHATSALCRLGGQHWRDWIRALRPVVLHEQCPDGNCAGSWNPTDCWGEEGGRIYTTAMVLLTLLAPIENAR